LQIDLQGEDSKDSTNKDVKVVNGSNNNNNNKNNRAEHWKSFIESLRKLVDINSSIEKNKKKQWKK
jgi:hypothetical protein